LSGQLEENQRWQIAILQELMINATVPVLKRLWWNATVLELKIHPTVQELMIH
jgi:hypothetical protein